MDNTAALSRPSQAHANGRSVASARRPAGRLPILYKVLAANAAIVLLGAVAGTWITIQVVRRAPENEFALLALGFALGGFVLSLVANLLVLRVAFRPLTELQAVAAAVRRGDLAVRAGQSTMGAPEIADLARTLNETLDELERDHTQLRSIASQVIRAQEDERRRISRELHDDTAQVLFAQLLRLSALKASSDEQVQATASSLEQSTVEALEGVRRLALELRPPALDDLGLAAALGGLAQRFAEQLDIPVDYQFRGNRGRLSPDLELVLYRVAQEALTNVAKHARARSVQIDLDRSSDDVTLSVRDDGRGFVLRDPAIGDDAGLGLGLFGMEERVHLVGGRLRIWSRRGHGTEVFAYVPVSPRGGIDGKRTVA